MGGREKVVDFCWMEESNGEQSVPMKRKRTARPKKIEFVRWGSKQLIEFLESVGQDTSKQLSQLAVAAIINEYVKANNLLHREKKKKIQCDEKLHSIFGKKVVSHIKVYDLLEAHFTENHDESDDEPLYSSEEKDENVIYARTEQKSLSSGKKPLHPKKKVVETPKSIFAAIIPENIKLLYLKKAVVQNLLKDGDGFEEKIVGSYVRVKCDPRDYTQKNSHQLLQVTGVTKSSQTIDAMEVLLQVSYFIKDVEISQLSDGNFSEEECEDLRQKIKDGLIKKPTVVEFEQKAQILHESITKHWIVRELSSLQNRIDRANEKGWRKELFEYLERRKLLATPSEQSRLLLEVPKVVAEEIPLEAVPEDALAADVGQASDESPRSIPKGASESSMHGGTVNQASSNEKPCGSGDAAIPFLSAVEGEASSGLVNGIMHMEEPGYRDAAIPSNSTVGREATRGLVNESMCMDDPGSVDAAIPSHSAVAGREASRGLVNGIMPMEEPGSIDAAVPSCSAVGGSEPSIGLVSGTMHTEERASIDAAIPYHSALGGSKASRGLVNRIMQMEEPEVQSPIIVQDPQSLFDRLTKETSRTIHLIEPQKNMVTQAKPMPPPVIELSDDDDDQEVECACNEKRSVVENLETPLWLYSDPRGDMQGPFPLTALKQWYDADYFVPDFKVWKVGESLFQAVLLRDLLFSNFS